jgi:hypothetical protein
LPSLTQPRSLPPRSFQTSSTGTTLVFVNIALPQPKTSSSDVTASFASVEALFSDCQGTGNKVGCAADPAKGLVVALQQFGLPISNAYYNDQLPN